MAGVQVGRDPPSLPGLFPGRGWGRRRVALLPSSPQLQGQTTPIARSRIPIPYPRVPLRRYVGRHAQPHHPTSAGGRVRRSALGSSRDAWLRATRGCLWRATRGCLWCPTAGRAHRLGHPPLRPIPRGEAEGHPLASGSDPGEKK
ncbi:hypothetical protein NDU88_000864 [Pleurodeles waltl]|uniref:Uncharacterized protein n=1 Tax=Pleurodeles waltl TaxID=8319 RepID=A0AAV7V7W1_PLEWA|nr:hypothetical protein NDU88_000864 [Pleurodeles waltl]